MLKIARNMIHRRGKKWVKDMPPQNRGQKPISVAVIIGVI